jgi:hypothetical protein
MTDDIPERVRKIGATTIRSIGRIARLQRVPDNDPDFVDPADMLSELREDDKALVLGMRAVHALCDEAGDVATPRAFWRTGPIRLSAASGTCLNLLASDRLRETGRLRDYSDISMWQCLMFC